MNTPPPSPDSLNPVVWSNAPERIIVASNRLSVTVKNQNGQYQYSPSSGGLASGMSGVSKDHELLWYGWTGLEIPDHQAPKVTSHLRNEHNAVPVYFDEALAKGYYSGFSNTTLWPVLHYQTDAIHLEDGHWSAYCEVNRRFASRIATDAEDGDLVWIHDYHLLLLPSMLSEAAAKQNKTLTIGFFLHTAFPSGDIFKVIPQWNKILESLLRCNLIGFHSRSYAENFKRTCIDLLPCTDLPTGLDLYGRYISIEVCPIGIDAQKIEQHMSRPSFPDKVCETSRKYGGSRLVLGVDRLDYIKGLPQKLEAFETLLGRHPEWIGELTLVQVAVPSREDVQEYKDLADTLHTLVERINAKYGSKTYQPVVFLHQSVPFDQLLALYAAADVCFVSSLRDGMNLVSYEYVATQKESHGVLLLSEFAGASEQLKGALLFNPWDKCATAAALNRALTMGSHERAMRQRQSEAFVMKNTSSAWGKTFVNKLRASTTTKISLRLSTPDSEDELSKPKLSKMTTPLFNRSGIQREALIRRETYG